MTEDADSAVAALQERVRKAAHDGEALAITGGGTKSFLGRVSRGTPCSVHAIQGVVHHEPTELVVTVRAGTRLAELESRLAQSGQMLPFEPPALGEGATIGGTIACGLSGPSRPYRGAARDFVLGVRCINGKGEILRFGGEVMKNVAGYDVSRLMAGAMGTLGILTEISLKVLPRPACSQTRAFEMPGEPASELMTSFLGRSLPISAAAYLDGVLRVRLSGSEAAVSPAAGALGGELEAEGDAFWSDLKEHCLDFFSHDSPLWRISLKPQTQLLRLPGKTLIDWGGAQYWVKSDAGFEALSERVMPYGGYITGFGGRDQGARSDVPQDAVMKLNRRLKAAFDPAGILNPGRLLPED
ncbi:MAG: glycolate oxidase subunit GlcE [Proteobacteria bacterium TMED51]|jgi:glycolate oxidase FAD binding subunit|nr:MAG: glycolate oxidase subunit GlcE [Proteobacteria bacterium TMED51]|tara:strand:- start:3962 stop:5029 length:1068 start_codon:yes stop_codon:yes gene_type:complete